MKKWLIFCAVVIAIGVGAVAYHKVLGTGSVVSGVEVDWRTLGEMDYITGKASKELKDLDGKIIKIPGFMVPLEDDQKDVVEFLLVPSPQACIHVPAPPPNQMIYVKMKKGTGVAQGPIWVYGQLNIVTKKSMYGDSSFEVIGDGVTEYK